MTTNPIIEAQGLTRRFGKREAVSGLDLQVPARSVFALLGPNGAGKTTTIYMLMNILEPTAGSATVLGQRSSHLGPAEFRRIGYVSENQELPGWMTVRQMLSYYKPFYPTWDDDLCTRLLKQYALPPDQRIKHLSRGMKMKAALLSSLAYRPQLLVLDEPFTGLDPLVREELIHGILELSEQESWTVLVSSHDVDEVQRLADWVAVINEGRLYLAEPLMDLQPRFRQIDVTLDAQSAAPTEHPPSWIRVERAGNTVRIIDSHFIEGESEAKVRMVLDGCRYLSVEPLSLRDLLLVLLSNFRNVNKGSSQEVKS